MEQKDLYRIARRRAAAKFGFLDVSASGMRERAIADELHKLEATPGPR